MKYQGSKNCCVILAMIHLVIHLVGLAAAKTADADPLNLEGAFTVAGSFPGGSGHDVPFASLGFLGQVNYEVAGWGFGVRSRGTLTTNTPFHVKADSYNLYGNLMRRQIALEILTRYFFINPTKNRRWYLEFGILGLETDFVHAETVYVSPESQDYTRLFLRGGGFSLGVGYRPDNGPFFIQINYELDHYETLLVVGDVKNLHPTLAEPALDSNYFVSSIYVTVGIDVFGR